MYKYNKTYKDKVLNALNDIQLKMIDELDRICKKYDIKYSLAGGSLLGAIRDGGIIPWDDDLDIYVTRKDYEKLINVINYEIDHEKYEFKCFEHDSNYHAQPAKLCLKGTLLTSKSFIRANVEMPVFVDIFVTDYVSDNEYKRNKDLEKIEFLRNVTYDKWLGRYKRVYFDTAYKRVKRFFYNFLPVVTLHNMHKKLSIQYENTPQEFSTDTSLLHVKNIFKSSYMNEMVDIEFEGRTLSITKDAEELIKCWYGSNCMSWLPVEDRGAWHAWADLDLGKYAKEYNLPDDYKKYMLRQLSEERLEHIKNLCFDMMKEVDRICEKNDLSYYVIGKELYFKAYDIEELSKYWKGHVVIALPREDYDRFAEVSKSELDEKYFYQSYKTDNNYWYPYAKIRLNNTFFRDRLLRFAKDIHHGLWIDIVPLDNISDNYKEAEKHSKKMNINWNLIRLKWLCPYKKFFKLPLKYKIAKLFVTFISIERLLNKFNNDAVKYNKNSTHYYYDSTRKFMGNTIMLNKNLFGKGKKLNILGHNLNFPIDIYNLAPILLKKKQKVNYKNISNIKKENTEYYSELTSSLTPDAIDRINNKIKFFNLGFYDHPEYILSCLYESQDKEKVEERLEYIREKTGK